jgi:uncharacterized membrane protein
VVNHHAKDFLASVMDVGLWDLAANRLLAVEVRAELFWPWEPVLSRLFGGKCQSGRWEASLRFSYRSRLANDLDRWREQGLVGGQARDAMLEEYDSHASGYSFASIVALLGVICLCFAAMTFVAANWQEMPRLMRVGLLLVAMWVSYGLAFVARDREQDWLAQGAVLLGCGIFGASIMLVAQMYHMQGQASGAVLMWAAGTIVAALALRSTPALVLAIVLFALWHWQVVTVDARTFGKIVNYPFVFAWGLCAAGAWFLKSRLAAHCLAVTGFAWLWSTAAVLSSRHDDLTFVTCLYMLNFLAIAALIFIREHRRALADFDDAMIGYLILIIGIGVAIWVVVSSLGQQTPASYTRIAAASIFPSLLVVAGCGAFAARAYLHQSVQVYDLVFIGLWTLLTTLLMHTPLRSVPFINEAYGLAVSIWMIRMGRRQEVSSATRLGYLLFTGLMLVIYFRTAGTILGTAGFYLLSGLVMVLSSVFLPRFLRAIGARKGVAS